MIKEAHDILLGHYKVLFDTEFFQSILLKERQDGESICMILVLFLFVVVPSSGIDCIAAFLKNRIQSYIHIADDVADEVLR